MPISLSFLFSQSNLQDFVDCPRRFYLKHIRKLAWPSIESEPVLENEFLRLQGERFHKMIHQYFIGIPVEKISSLSADPILSSWWENFLSSLKGLLDPQNSMLHPELAVSTLHGGCRLIAKYDLLSIHSDGSFAIFDWKTYRKRPRRERLAQKLQTRLYPFILSSPPNPAHTAPENLRLLYWYANFPAQPEIFTYSASQRQQDAADISRLLSAIVHAADSGTEADFPLTANLDRCLYCVYRSLCDRGTQAGQEEELGDEADFDSGLEGFDFDQVTEVEF